MPIKINIQQHIQYILHIYGLHIPFTSVPLVYGRLEELCTLQNTRVYIYTIPVLLDGHVQHTDKLAKSHMSVSIKYGLNKFQFNKFFFSVFTTCMAISSSIHSQVVCVRLQLQSVAFKYTLYCFHKKLYMLFSTPNGVMYCDASIW